MKPFLTFLTLSLVILTCEAQTRFQMGGQQVTSSAHRLYVNDQMKTRPSRYTFRTVNEALLFAQANNDKDTLWTDICIEPSVYWIDDPDDPAIRVSDVPRESPFGLKVKVDRLRLIGLSDNPEDVVIACNRGQTQGSDGNFTMLHFTGNDIHAENITFGNYCNVDLVYPRNPRLNRPKRNPAIVQAQLVICRGDRYTIRNCRFISRLNLCPFVGADHVDFDHCYFECTDDALCGTGTYRQCGFTFYGSKPFYATSREGATFIDCDIHSKVRGTQYLTKASSPVTMRDCRWTSDDPDLQLAWTPKPNPKHVCVMTGCTLNGRPYNVPTTPDVPMPMAPLGLPLQNQPDIIPGQWTLDAYKPSDLGEYNWSVRPAPAHPRMGGTGQINAPEPEPSVWAYGEGEDGAEGCFGLIPVVRGARMMYTGREGEQYKGQRLTLSLNPCKEMGQGFGSATGQYLDICIKFDTRTLTGYGLRFIRTPNHHNAVEVWLVEYRCGQITPITKPQTCYLFRRGCKLTLTASEGTLTARISNDQYQPDDPALAQPMTLSAPITHPNPFGGIHIQHTGSLGASATLFSDIHSSYLEK